PCSGFVIRHSFEFPISSFVTRRRRRWLPYRTPLIFRPRPCRYFLGMSIYRRMLGRELPCTLRQLLGIEPKALSAKQLEAFERRAELQTAYVQTLHRLGLCS